MSAKSFPYKKLLILEDQLLAGLALCEMARRFLSPECEIIWGEGVIAFDNAGARITRIINPFDESISPVWDRRELDITWDSFSGELAIIDGSIGNLSGRLFLRPLMKAKARCVTAGADEVYNNGALEDNLAHAKMDKPHSAGTFYMALLKSAA